MVVSVKGVTITIDLTVEEIEKLSRKYHFNQGDITLIQSVYDLMRPYIRGEIFTKMVEEDTPLREAMLGISLADGSKCEENISHSLIYTPPMAADGSKYAAAIVTLGAGVDKLQESYLEKEILKEAYIMDCLGGELLFKAYAKLEDILYCETGLHGRSFEFLGDSYPLSMVPEIFAYLEQDTVIYNKAYELLPLKSVVLFVRLKKGEKDSSKCPFLNICSNCSNLQCENRSKEETGKNLNYGYRSIFRGK